MVGYNSAMEEMRIDWRSAEVEDGRLSVSLEEKPSKGWREHFERTIVLLGSREFPQVGVKKGEIRVDGVREGAEEDLRRFLEGVVDQANTAVAAEDAHEPDNAEASEDARLTAAFRAFADEPER